MNDCVFISEINEIEKVLCIFLPFRGRPIGWQCRYDGRLGRTACFDQEEEET